MNSSPTEILRQGCAMLEPLLVSHGFAFQQGPSGRGSGGKYSSGWYTNGERRIELHFRLSLGLVTYHFGELSLSHDEYMFAVLGKNGGNKYPAFSDQPLDAFRGLAHDLERHGLAFLNGDLEEFRRFTLVAKEERRLSGFARLAKHES